eukprot:c15342_g1_i1.p1 GENE.c15342_g1_i1~~c15342_g1_i1.p1  ORF type:complete len:248 (+),score=44.95 c15342_g1_i1:37-780(+)
MVVPKFLALCAPDNSVFTRIMLGYSILPLLCVCLQALLILRNLHSSRLVSPHIAFFVCAVTATGLNEAIVKQIIKQPRPVGSCSQSYGMPSGHSLLASMQLVWYCFGLSHRGSTRHSAKYLPLTVGLDPSTTNHHHFWRTILNLVLYSCLFLPVMPARVFVKAHTAAQVTVGMSCGVVYGLVLVRWFYWCEGRDWVESQWTRFLHAVPHLRVLKALSQHAIAKRFSMIPIVVVASASASSARFEDNV